MSGEAEDAAGLASELDPTEHFPFRHLERCRKAVVAAVNGVCHAGGLNLVLFSDLTIASEQARFRAPELLRGAPDPWIAARLAQYVGIGVAKYLLYTAAEISAHEALAMGLVGRVFPHAGFAQAADEVCQQIRATAPGARAIVKDLMNRSLPVPDAQVFQRAIQSPELAEGMSAFLEKRPPRWPPARPEWCSGGLQPATPRDLRNPGTGRRQRAIGVGLKPAATPLSPRGWRWGAGLKLLDDLA